MVYGRAGFSCDMTSKVPKSVVRLFGEVMNVFVCGYDRFPHLTEEPPRGLLVLVQ
jgi:hypothetical protein